MVFNATLNNISVISWRSVLLVGETGVPEENHRTVAAVSFIGGGTGIPGENHRTVASY